MRIAVVTDSQPIVAHTVLMISERSAILCASNLTNEVLSATAEPFYRQTAHQRAWMVELRPSSCQHASGAAWALARWEAATDPYQTLKRH
jgi:hypothetical protein